jgi:hypothetical protein
MKNITCLLNYHHHQHLFHLLNTPELLMLLSGILTYLESKLFFLIVFYNGSFFLLKY